MWCGGYSSSNRPCLYASGGHRVRSPCYSDAQPYKPYIWDTPWSIPNIGATPKIISNCLPDTDGRNSRDQDSWAL